MPKLEIRYTKSFEEQFEKEGMHAPASLDRIQRLIESVDPHRGRVYPRLVPGKEIRQIPIGKNEGLRLIYEFILAKHKIIPVAVFQKGAYGSENDTLRKLKEKLKRIDAEI